MAEVPARDAHGGSGENDCDAEEGHRECGPHEWQVAAELAFLLASRTHCRRRHAARRQTRQTPVVAEDSTRSKHGDDDRRVSRDR